MKETIAVTVLVEIDYVVADKRETAVSEAMTYLTRDQPGDFWYAAGFTSMNRSRAIQARRTKQRIMPRKGER